MPSVADERWLAEGRPVDVQGRLVTDESGERDHDDRDHGPPSGTPGDGVRDDADRPADVRATRSALLDQRNPIDEEVATAVVDTSGRSLREVTEEVLRVVRGE